MITEVNTYINTSEGYPDEKMFGFKKNRMYVFYNMDHYSRDNKDYMVRLLINEMIGKYHFSFQVEFVESDKNKVVVKQVRAKSNPAKLRLAQIKANREVRELLSAGHKSPKI